MIKAPKAIRELITIEFALYLMFYQGLLLLEEMSAINGSAIF